MSDAKEENIKNLLSFAQRPFTPLDIEVLSYSLFPGYLPWRKEADLIPNLSKKKYSKEFLRLLSTIFPKENQQDRIIWFEQLRQIPLHDLRKLMRIYLYEYWNYEDTDQIAQLQREVAASDLDKDYWKLDVPNSEIIKWQKSKSIFSEGPKTVLEEFFDVPHGFPLEEYFLYLKSLQENPGLETKNIESVVGSLKSLRFQAREKAKQKIEDKSLHKDPALIKDFTPVAPLSITPITQKPLTFIEPTKSVAKSSIINPIVQYVVNEIRGKFEIIWKNLSPRESNFLLNSIISLLSQRDLIWYVDLRTSHQPFIPPILPVIEQNINDFIRPNYQRLNISNPDANSTQVFRYWLGWVLQLQCVDFLKPLFDRLDISPYIKSAGSKGEFLYGELPRRSPYSPQTQTEKLGVKLWENQTWHQHFPSDWDFEKSAAIQICDQINYKEQESKWREDKKRQDPTIGLETKSIWGENIWEGLSESLPKSNELGAFVYQKKPFQESSRIQQQILQPQLQIPQTPMPQKQIPPTQTPITQTQTFQSISKTIQPPQYSAPFSKNVYTPRSSLNNIFFQMRLLSSCCSLPPLIPT